VVDISLLSSNEGQSTWLAPVTRVSDTVYSRMGRLNSCRVQDMLRDVVVNDDIVTFGGVATAQ
jgi:hypothetical protein